MYLMNDWARIIMYLMNERAVACIKGRGVLVKSGRFQKQHFVAKNANALEISRGDPFAVKTL